MLLQEKENKIRKKIEALKRNQRTTPLCWYGIDYDVRRVKMPEAMGKLKCLV